MEDCIIRLEADEDSKLNQLIQETLNGIPNGHFLVKGSVRSYKEDATIMIHNNWVMYGKNKESKDLSFYDTCKLYTAQQFIDKYNPQELIW